LLLGATAVLAIAVVAAVAAGLAQGLQTSSVLRPVHWRFNAGRGVDWAAVGLGAVG